MQKNEWKAHFQRGVPDHVRLNIQIAYSTVKHPNHHGDVTIAINCDAFQEEAPAWTTFSDAHRVVIAPVRLLATQSITLAAPRLASAEQPASKVTDMRQLHAPSPADSSHRATSTAASAEQPASEERQRHAASPADLLDRAASTAASAEQPVSEDAIPAANLDVPLSTTPLYAQMVDNLAAIVFQSELEELLRTPAGVRNPDVS